MTDKKRKGFWSKFAYRELSKTANSQEDNELFLLSIEELEKLKQIRKATLLKAGLTGAIGVILLYAPYYGFGANLFPANKIWIPYYEDFVELEIGFLIYSLFLVLFEIWYLTYLNIKSVASIARACGYPNPNDPNFENNIDSLIAVGLDKKQKQLEAIGINPYEGLNPFGVLVFQLIIRLKAAVSGMLFKLLIKKALGRYALRAIIDFAGIPVYAFWNIWGSRMIMNETRVRVMAPPLIKKCAEQLFEEFKDDLQFKDAIYDTLQLISESKRSFHYNHFLLSISLLEVFGIDVIEEPPYNDDFLEEIPALSANARIGIQKLFVFGILIDGALSRRERKAIRFLIEKNVLAYTEEEVAQWSKDYFEGKGVESFFEKH
jgi:hypothetical protein